MEFAVIKTGGKQYKVSIGDTISIEKIIEKTKDTSKTLKTGDRVVFDKVLLWDNGKDTSIGTPYIKGAEVLGTVVKEGRKPKVDVIKYKQKSRYFKKYGHRQPFISVKIDSIK